MDLHRAARGEAIAAGRVTTDGEPQAAVMLQRDVEIANREDRRYPVKRAHGRSSQDEDPRAIRMGTNADPAPITARATTDDRRSGWRSDWRSDWRLATGDWRSVGRSWLAFRPRMDQDAEVDARVDDYLAGLDESQRSALSQLRQTILELVPEVQE
jgi:hypothetical protein